MGRGKLKMEMIKNEKSRLLTLKKRKQGLFKKLHEITTLCGVPACMIVHDRSDSAAASSVWPEDSPDEVRRLVDGYRAAKNNQSTGSGVGVKSYGLPDFFSGRRKEIEGEVEKLRKKKYSGWDERLSGMDEFQLRNLAAQVRLKAHNVRIQLMMKREGERERERERSEQQQFQSNNYYLGHGDDFLAAGDDFLAAQIPVMNVQPSYYYDLPPPPPPPPQPLQYYPANGDYFDCDLMDGSIRAQQGYWVGNGSFYFDY